MRGLKKVLLIVILSTFIFMITGCGNKNGVLVNNNKKALTADGYKSKMEDKGYTVIDASDQVSQYDYVKKLYIALNADRTYQIEFTEFSDNDNAIAFFENNKKNFEDAKGDSSEYTKVKLGNYDKYTLLTNGEYNVVARIDNTTIYLNVDEEYKNDVQSTLKDLGY